MPHSLDPPAPNCASNRSFARPFRTLRAPIGSAQLGRSSNCEKSSWTPIQGLTLRPPLSELRTEPLLR